jgi:putative ABC transport system ATP-binding protein
MTAKINPEQEGLRRGDTEVRALDGVTVDFPAGQFTAVMGPSGSGKSTLLHCMAGLDRPTSGTVMVGDTDITALKENELTRLRRDRVGFVFQAFNLMPTLTAEENIELPMRLAGAHPDRGWVDTVIDAVGLRSTGSATALRALRRPAAAGRRSAGPGRRPEIVFADEPTGNLDSSTLGGGELLSLLRRSVASSARRS